MMVKNHMLEMARLVASLPVGPRPRLLLHVCCAPCACGALPALTPHFETTMLFYNPNIRPEAEYQKRLDYVRRLKELLPEARGVALIESGRRGPDYEQVAAGREGEAEGGARCELCFRLRLGETARQAKALGFDYFCTTLTVGTRKDAGLINAIGRELESLHGVRWLPSDLKKGDGNLRSVRLSEELGIYRQEYCGCGYELHKPPRAQL